MNNNDYDFIARQIRSQYTQKEPTKLDELRALDRKVKKPANVFAYIFADNFHRGLRLLHIFEFFRGDGTLGGLLHAKSSQTGHQFGRGNAQLGGGISDFYFFHSYSPYEICA